MKTTVLLLTALATTTSATAMDRHPATLRRTQRYDRLPTASPVPSLVLKDPNNPAHYVSEPLVSPTPSPRLTQSPRPLQSPRLMQRPSMMNALRHMRAILAHIETVRAKAKTLQETEKSEKEPLLSNVLTPLEQLEREILLALEDPTKRRPNIGSFLLLDVLQQGAQISRRTLPTHTEEINRVSIILRQIRELITLITPQE